MNYRIQAEIIKNPSGWAWDADGDGNVFFTDGVMVKKAPRSECLLDLNKLKEGKLSQYFEDSGLWDDVNPTKLRLKETGYTAIKLEGEKQVCWINERYFKMFKKYDFEYSGGTYVRVRHPENCEIVAIILVIRLKKDEAMEQENKEN